MPNLLMQSKSNELSMYLITVISSALFQLSQTCAWLISGMIHSSLVTSYLTIMSSTFPLHPTRCHRILYPNRAGRIFFNPIAALVDL